MTLQLPGMTIEPVYKCNLCGFTTPDYEEAKEHSRLTNATPIYRVGEVLYHDWTGIIIKEIRVKYDSVIKKHIFVYLVTTLAKYSFAERGFVVDVSGPVEYYEVDIVQAYKHTSDLRSLSLRLLHNSDPDALKKALDAYYAKTQQK